MTRNRVIIAGGIVVLILIALFFWLGGDDASDGQMADRQTPPVEGAGTAPSADGAPPAVDDKAAATGAEGGGDRDAADTPSQAADAAPAQAGAGTPVQGQAVRQSGSAAAVVSAADRSGETPATATQPATEVAPGREDASAPSRTGQTNPADTGRIAEVTKAPDAVASAASSLAERRPVQQQDSAAKDGAAKDGAATGGAATGGAATDGAAKDSGTDESGGGAGDGDTVAASRTATDRADPERSAADRTATSRATAGQDGAGGEGSRQAAATPPERPAPETAEPDRRTQMQVASRPETPEETAARERQTRAGGGDVSAPLPSFDIVRISQDCRAVIAGRAMPRALVVVSLGEDRLGEVMADRRGEWVLIPDQPLRPGPGEMRLSAMAQGGPAVQGSEGVIVSVPDCGKNEGQRGPIIALRTDDRENRPSRILQLPGTTGPGGDLRLDTVDYDEAGKLILSGRAEPSTRVNIYANNAPVGQVHSDSEGRWSLLVDDKVPLGQQTLRLDQVGDRGVVKSRVEFPFSRASFRDLDLSDRSVIVQPGNSLWRIARRIYGEGPRYTVIYEANTEQIRNPDLIYPGQIFSLPAESPAADRG
ncbi:MAG: LysM peptidoglycan-binding domain-containing protein [Sneathiellaceae bacterium]